MMEDLTFTICDLEMVTFQQYVGSEIEFRATFSEIDPDYCNDVFILSKLNTLRLFTTYLFNERKTIIVSDNDRSQQKELLLNYSKMDMISSMTKECHNVLYAKIIERYETVQNNDIDARLTILEKHYDSIIPFDFTK